jgi:hypothetical protein
MIELDPKRKRRMRGIGALVGSSMLLSFVVGPYPTSGVSEATVYGIALAVVLAYLAIDFLMLRANDENMREKLAWRDFILLTLSMAYFLWELFAGGPFPAYPLALHAATVVPMLIFVAHRTDLYEDPESIEGERDRLIRMVSERAGYSTMLGVVFLSPVVLEFSHAPSTNLGLLRDWFEYYFIFCMMIGMWVEHYVSVSRYLRDRPALWDSGWNVFGHIEMLYTLVLPNRRDRR